MATNTLNQLKENIQTLNKRISAPNFYQELCDFSQNDINLVIQNLSKIIAYYLYSDDKITSDQLSTLFIKINHFQIQCPKYAIHPTNNFYARKMKRNGVNSNLPFMKMLDSELICLAEFVSVYPNLIPYGISLYTEIQEALKEALFSPSIVYKDILKQPQKQELPISVGEAENIYYENVFQKRLTGTRASLVRTSANMGKRVLSKIVGQKAVLVFLPIEQVPNMDLLQGETALHISANKLAFLEIPTYYTLLNFCVQNKGIEEGTKIEYKTGEIHKESKPATYTTSRYYYNRYEKISVTEQFEYQNSEFTGDTLYDIDLIYGSLDSNNSREVLENSFDVNYAKIKEASDIKVRKKKDKYTILNGRHRLLYLKHYYLTNYQYYSEAGQLDRLKEKVTIPMLVEHTIEDQEFVRYLDKINTLASFTLLKNDIRNDNLEFIIIIEDYVYCIRSAIELADLYNLLVAKKYRNPYYIGKNIKQKAYVYEELMRRLIIVLKKEIENLSFLDLIQYIATNPEIVNGLNIETNNLNFAIFHHIYINFLNKITISKIYNRKIDIIAEAIGEKEAERIGEQIIEFLNQNPEYTKMPWTDLYEILHQIPEFSSYDSDYLRECANGKGYQTKLLKLVYNEE